MGLGLRQTVRRSGDEGEGGRVPDPPRRRQPRLDRALRGYVGAAVVLRRLSLFRRRRVLVVLNWVTGWGLPVHYLALAVAFGPLVVSLATLVLPLGGWWFEHQEGGRRPSERERAAFEAAFAQLRSADPSLRPAQRWFVTDEAEPNACVYANALMVTRGLLDSAFFPAVLAHELGHLNSSDARVTAAVYRITTPPRNPVERPFRIACLAVSGRIGWRRCGPSGRCTGAAGRHGRRRVRRKARAGRRARGLPRRLRAGGRPANPVQGLRRHLPPLDRAPHRRPPGAAGQQLTPGREPVKVAPAGRPFGLGLTPLPVTEPRPCVEVAITSAEPTGQRSLRWTR